MFVILCLLGGSFATATPAAASAPVLLSGSAWLDGNGVNVCTNNNGGAFDPYCGGEYQIGNATNYWQCVELAQRLYKKRGWHAGIFANVWGAKDIYDQAGALGMDRQSNGSIGAIVPGDMIIHGSDEPCWARVCRGSCGRLDGACRGAEFVLRPAAGDVRSLGWYAVAFWVGYYSRGCSRSRESERRWTVYGIILGRR